MEILTAQNIFLDENTGGKGRHFTSRFLQPGLVKYSFGVCLLAKETIDKFIYQFVGCPVIINHKDVTNESAKDDRMGVVSRVWFDQMDGWYWCEGIIFEEQAISLIEDGYNVSCQYEITEYSNNTTKALHNGNPYDKVILNGKPEHLAIVKTPRYEAAMIAINALDLTAENEEHWITIGGGDDTKGHHVLVKDGETNKEATERTIARWKEKENKINGRIKSFEDKGFKKAEEKGAGNRWHLKKDGKIHTIVQTTGDKFRFSVSEWDDEKGGGKDIFDKTSLSEDELNEYINKYINDKSDTKDGEVEARKKDIEHKKQLRRNKSDAWRKLQEAKRDFEEKGIGSLDKIDKLADEYEKAEKEYNNSFQNKQSDTKDGKDLYSDENFKYNAKRLNEQFGEKPYSEWQKDVQTMLKKYGKTEEDFDNAIGARKDAFKQSDSKGEKANKYRSKFSDIQNLVGSITPGEQFFDSKIRTAEKRLKDKLEAWEKDYEKETKPAVKQMKKRNIEVVKDELEQLNKLKSNTAKNTIVQAINEIKETNMFKNLFNKKEQKMEKDELKEIFMDCIQDVLKAQNEDEEEKKKIDDAENEDEEKEEKAENKKACNEDKRKLIDEVAGMMKSAGCDDEVIRTAIAKMEKIGYDKSEAGTVDNGKKAKCEDEEEKEEALNKAKNSIEALKGLISQVDVRKPASKYMTKADAIELGNKLF